MLKKIILGLLILLAIVSGVYWIWGVVDTGGDLLSPESLSGWGIVFFGPAPIVLFSSLITMGLFLFSERVRNKNKITFLISRILGDLFLFITLFVTIGFIYLALTFKSF